MKELKISVKLILFIIAFTASGTLLYLLCEQFHSSSFLHLSPASSQSIADTVIVLDPGHGGEDGGAVAADGTLEKDLNLRITEDIAQILKYSGFHVILTREEDKMLSGSRSNGKKKQADLSARLEMAQSAEQSIFVSIHMNKFSDQRCKGLQVYYSKNAPESKRLAQTVQNTVASTIQQNNSRQIKEATSAIYILDHATVPAILVECGFLSNPEDLAKLKDEEYQKNLAAVISAAIINGVIDERT